MFDYASNSNKSKKDAKKKNKPKPKPKKGAVSVRKKSDFRKFIEWLLPDDLSEIPRTILDNYVGPLVRNSILDTVTYLVGGDPKVRSGYSKTSYSNYYERKGSSSDSGRRDRGIFSYDDITFEYRTDAKEVLDGMYEILEEFKVVSVADLYDLAEVSSSNYTANKYGWTDLRNANIVRQGNAYKLKLPKAMPID